MGAVIPALIGGLALAVVSSKATRFRPSLPLLNGLRWLRAGLASALLERLLGQLASGSMRSELVTRSPDDPAPADSSLHQPKPDPLISAQHSLDEAAR